MIPEKVRIGCFEYKVIRTSDILVVDGRQCKGKIDYEKNEIYIWDTGDHGEQSKEQTFWHEIVHAIIHERNFSLSKADEETSVDELATGIYSLMKDNDLLPGQRTPKGECQ